MGLNRKKTSETWYNMLMMPLSLAIISKFIDNLLYIVTIGLTAPSIRDVYIKTIIKT